MANHHPNEELLMAYSASSLPISQALCVSTHLEFCEQCRSHTQKLNSIGGLLLESLAPKAGSSKLKGQVMALLDEPHGPAKQLRWLVTPSSSHDHCANL